jgi:hypothetical protein
MKSQKLSLKLFTETEGINSIILFMYLFFNPSMIKYDIVIFCLDSLMLNIENIYLQFNCVQKLQFQQFKQTYGEIIINDAAISLNNFNSNDLVLHPIQIVIKIRLPSPKSGPLQEEIFANLNVDYLTLDLSQNRCKSILFIWKTYKYLFEKKNTIALVNDGQNFIPKLQIFMSVVKTKVCINV